MKVPVISVVMSAYNAKEYLSQALDSILAQTFGDFEFIITNDGSTDDTQNVLEDYSRKDGRIKVIQQRNMGLTESLNQMVAIAKGEFIARMDADDISFPERFERQKRKFQDIPDYLAVGSWFQVVRKSNLPDCEIVFPDRPEILKKCLREGMNCYAHGSVMIRKAVFNELGFRYRFKFGQDMDLWLRLCERGPLGMVEEVLYQQRVHGRALSQVLIPQRSALMNIMLSLMKERKTHGREISDWKEEENKALNGIPEWTEKEIEAYDLFLDARRLLCSGNNVRARQILASIRGDLGEMRNILLSYYISCLPGFITAPMLRFRDKINNKRCFVRHI